MSEVSLVIVSLVGGTALVDYLQSLRPLPAECLVLFDSSKNNMKDLQEQFPAVHFANKDKLPVPIARKRGIELVSGGIVVLLEDTSLPIAGWFDAVKNAFTDPDVVAAGGPVVLSPTLSSKYLALGCAEYGRFHPDRFSMLADGQTNEKGLTPVTRLPGNNLAYRRKPLLEVLGGNAHGLIEGKINEKLRASGYKLHMHPAMTVTYTVMDRYGARLKTRFNHGRLFAGNRVAGQNRKARISWLLKSMLLPPVLTLRGWSNMTNAVELIAWPKVMAWIFLMETAWSVGEAVGYLKGVGHSLDTWN